DPTALRRVHADRADHELEPGVRLRVEAETLGGAPAVVEVDHGVTLARHVVHVGVVHVEALRLQERLDGGVVLADHLSNPSSQSFTLLGNSTSATCAAFCPSRCGGWLREPNSKPTPPPGPTGPTSAS